jgi:hypothetical protein
VDWFYVSAGRRTHITNCWSPAPGIVRTACGTDIRLPDVVQHDERKVCARCKKFQVPVVGWLSAPVDRPADWRPV